MVASSNTLAVIWPLSRLTSSSYYYHIAFARHRPIKANMGFGISEDVNAVSSNTVFQSGLLFREHFQ
ncbi:hypothetical protein L6452_43089 [Arctium lappa]|uniref:Uncharacterized protein n=1 Tax=Arctium lappa TaxID=4217 RepID=A0ACB8XK30_ARCLA|nr:hypothetical protein L6452_43089 [Arctium lappa]